MSDPARLNAEGMAALARGAHAEAARLFEAAAAGDPRAPALRLNLATAHRRLGDAQAERAALDAALAIDQRELTALVRLAELHERLGEERDAATRWSNVSSLVGAMPDRPPALDTILAHAQAYAAKASTRFAAALDAGLASHRAAADAPALRRFDACVAALTGRRRIYANQPEGLHYPFLPADEFFPREHFPWLGELEAATSAICAELESLLAGGADGLEPYVAMAPGTPASKWTPLDNKLDWSAYFLWRYGERRADACARCPATAAVLDRLPLAELPGRAPTAFFSILKPRTRLPAHTGVSNVRAIVHLPLIVPPGCGFRVGGETREWRVGEAFAFDDTIEHEAWNDSDDLRAVLILDTWNPHLAETERTLLREMFRVADGANTDSPGALRVGE